MHKIVIAAAFAVAILSGCNQSSEPLAEAEMPTSADMPDRANGSTENSSVQSPDKRKFVIYQSAEANIEQGMSRKAFDEALALLKIKPDRYGQFVIGEREYNPQFCNDELTYVGWGLDNNDQLLKSLNARTVGHDFEIETARVEQFSGSDAQPTDDFPVLRLRLIDPKGKQAFAVEYIVFENSTLEQLQDIRTLNGCPAEF